MEPVRIQAVRRSSAPQSSRLTPCLAFGEGAQRPTHPLDWSLVPPQAGPSVFPPFFKDFSSGLASCCSIAPSFPVVKLNPGARVRGAPAPCHVLVGSCASLVLASLCNGRKLQASDTRHCRGCGRMQSSPSPLHASLSPCIISSPAPNKRDSKLLGHGVSVASLCNTDFKCCYQ